jgi:hypothetical protein
MADPRIEHDGANASDLDNDVLNLLGLCAAARDDERQAFVTITRSEAIAVAAALNAQNELTLANAARAAVKFGRSDAPGRAATCCYPCGPECACTCHTAPPSGPEERERIARLVFIHAHNLQINANVDEMWETERHLGSGMARSAYAAADAILGNAPEPSGDAR